MVVAGFPGAELSGEVVDGLFAGELVVDEVVPSALAWVLLPVLVGLLTELALVDVAPLSLELVEPEDAAAPCEDVESVFGPALVLSFLGR